MIVKFFQSSINMFWRQFFFKETKAFFNLECLHHFCFATGSNFIIHWPKTDDVEIEEKWWPKYCGLQCRVNFVFIISIKRRHGKFDIPKITLFRHPVPFCIETRPWKCQIRSTYCFFLLDCRRHLIIVHKIIRWFVFFA